MVEIIKEIETKNIMTKSSLPVGGYSVNPYVGCPHACKYCYASFMKRFTKHSEPWGTFLDVKYWPMIKNPGKYAGELAVIGSVTDGYNSLEEKYGRTRALLEQLKYSNAKIMICTKSDLVLRDLDILTQMKDVTISWSINTLDEEFKNNMDEAVSIERRMDAMKKVYDSGIRTVCFVSPIFPGITDIPAIIERVKNQCDFIWLENLNLRGDCKKVILDYINEKHPELSSLYQEIYEKKNKTYWCDLEKQIQLYAKEQELPYIDNYLPEDRSVPGRPTVINYFYHEEVRGSDNKGIRTI
jgi:radical SAM mobile pair protein B